MATYRGFFYVLTALAISGCAPISLVSPLNNTIDLSQCQEPRPQVCTSDYMPVCGQLAAGLHKTYPNGCTACVDPAVSAFRPASCQ